MQDIVRHFPETVSEELRLAIVQTALSLTANALMQSRQQGISPYEWLDEKGLETAAEILVSICPSSAMAMA